MRLLIVLMVISPTILDLSKLSMRLLLFTLDLLKVLSRVVWMAL